jgi:hypothetical protein
MGPSAHGKVPGGLRSEIRLQVALDLSAKRYYWSAHVVFA